MTSFECPREADVIDSVKSRRWPNKAEPELRAHVSGCEVCTDVAEVASALHVEQESTWADGGALSPASVVWFRAQARGRAERARQAARPIAVMQALAFACAAAVISALIGVVAFWVWTRTDVLASFPVPTMAGLETVGFAIRGTLLAIGLWLVLAPFAVYLAASDD